MNIVNEIKALFSKAEDVQEVKFADYKTTDGLIIRIESLEQGKLVEVMDEAGTLTAAKAGELELEDGQILVIAEDGTIAEIKPADTEAPAEDAGEVEVQASEIEVELAEDPAAVAAEPAIDLEPRIMQLEEAVMMLAEKVNQLEGEKAAVEAEMSAIKEENEGLKMSTPAAEPVKFKKMELEVKPAKKVESKYSTLFEKK